MAITLNGKIRVKPFVKWVGGKTQLLHEIDKRLPQDLFNGGITKYVEPFVGSGAVLFFLLSRYNIKHSMIIDTNKKLINLYINIRDNLQAMEEFLYKYEDEYLKLSEKERKEYYLEKREVFNREGMDPIIESAVFVFLNKTCFNGLYRVNKNGKFNVPMGKYERPKIYDKENLRTVSYLLKNVTILHGDFDSAKEFVDKNTFVYLDPPYRPISKTSNFTSYVANNFNDNEQLRLRDFWVDMDKKGAKLMLSNSDPKNKNPKDNFFEKAYKGYIIERVYANRFINSKSNGRGKIREIIIRNYRR